MSKPDKRAIRRLIDAALAQKLARATADKKFKQITAKLAALGVQFADEWTPTEGGGNSWLAEGTDIVARVTYPADKLKDAINAASKDFIKIRQAAGEAFKHLFEAANYFQPVAGFRAKAVEILGQDKGGKLIKLCESDNEPKVSFEAGTLAERAD